MKPWLLSLAVLLTACKAAPTAPVEPVVTPTDEDADRVDPLPAEPVPGPEETALIDAAVTDEAVIALARECDGGAPASCADLGYAYSKGTAVALDADRALALYTTACDHDVARGCGYLAGWLTIEKDYPKALATAEKACAASDPVGCFNLGYLHSHGFGVAQDYARAAELYQVACEADIFDGCFNIAEFAELGQGTAKDPERAAEYYQRVCDSGAQWGCGPLARVIMKTAPARALELATGACTAGELEGCRVLGSVQLAGKDPAGAEATWRAACDSNDLPSCTLAGHLHRDGKQVRKNRGLARILYGKACDGGQQDACKALGKLGKLSEK